MNKIVKVAGGVLLAIFLGAVGSGVWEKILSPLLSYLFGSLTLFISSLSTKYSDSIFQNASTVQYNGQAGLVLLFFLMIACLSILYSSLASKRENKFIAPIHKNMKRYTEGWSGILASSAFFVFLVFMLATQSSVFQIRKYSLKQMDILRPYIGDHSYHVLYSNYLQIRNKNDFDRFLSRVYSYADKNNIELKKFSLK